MKRTIGKASVSFLLVLCALLLGSKASAQTQSPFITFDAPGAGTAKGQGTSALAISAAGGIVGTYTDSSGACHGFVRNPDGTFATFDSPPTRPPSQPTCPNPTSINSAGVVTGFYIDPSFGCPNWPDVFQCGGRHGFIRTADGTITVFDAPVNPSMSNPGTKPTSINSAGEIVGYYFTGDQDSSDSLFLRQPDGTIFTFDPPNANTFRPTGINSVNAQGSIVGDYEDDVAHVDGGFLRAPDGTFTNILAPGAGPRCCTDLREINSSGVIVGNFADSNYVGHGFLRAADGTFTVFDVPNACAGCTEAVGLNDRGTVVGTYFTPLGGDYNITHGFLRSADGTFTTFDPPDNRAYRFAGPPFALSSGISSSNAVAGTYVDANSVGHGFLRPGAPQIGSFTPSSGPAGTTVTITGTSFNGATGVAFNRAAASFTVESDTQITATVPGGATTGSLSVTAPWGTGWSFSGTPFTVESGGAPTISSFSPTSGATGWTVTLTGTNFTGTTGVSFNGTPATTMWAISDTQFNAKVPSGATSGPITLTNSLGSAASAASFTITPHISSFTPTSGTMGTTVTITGTSFTGATAATFFRVPASFTVNSDTQITATVPGGALSGWISVKTPNATLWSSSNFTPTSTGTPAISSFSPASGTVGTTITLTGTNFTGTTGVSINGTAATTYWATSDTQLNVKIPSGATSGPIAVTNTAGTTTTATTLVVN